MKFFKCHNLNWTKYSNESMWKSKKKKITHRLPFAVFTTNKKICFTCQKSSQSTQKLKKIRNLKTKTHLRLLKKRIKDIPLEHHPYVVQQVPIKPNQNDTPPIPTFSNQILTKTIVFLLLAKITMKQRAVLYFFLWIRMRLECFVVTTEKLLDRSGKWTNARFRIIDRHKHTYTWEKRFFLTFHMENLVATTTTQCVNECRSNVLLNGATTGLTSTVQ